jgi:hypothetical protein
MTLEDDAEAASPVGADGTAVQLPLAVVAVAGLEAGEAPLEFTASTV